MSLPPVIGLNGVARSGKDTLAGILHGLYGYEIYSFSEILNETLIALNPVVYSELLQARPDVYRTHRYAEIEKRLGYEGAKEIPEVRRLLQAMGTEVGRRFFGEDVWVEALFRKINVPRAVITNVRFPNEYAAVKARKGLCWRVDRPGFEPALDHISDRALDDHSFDQHFYNDGTVEELAHKVNNTMEAYFRNRKQQALR